MNHKRAVKSANKPEDLDSAASTTAIVIAPAKATSTQKTETTPAKSLTTAEKDLLQQHEDTIKQGLSTFHDVGMAFAEIRDLGLYREHGTFDEYCNKVWGVSRSKAYRYMAAAKCVKHLECSQLATKEPLAVPETEAQARNMAKLTPKQQEEVAKKVAKKKSKPIAKDFDEAADEYFDKPRVKAYTPDIPVKEGSSVAEDPKKDKPNVTALTFDSGLSPLAELQKAALEAYSIFSDSQKRQQLEKLLWKLKEGLKEWAQWQAKQSTQEAA